MSPICVVIFKIPVLVIVTIEEFIAVYIYEINIKLLMKVC